MASINEIKALASRKGGFAQSSQFLVKLPDIGFYNTRDLNILCKTLNFKNIGARNLTGMILGFRISKRQQTSNWEAKDLSEGQLRYAATDAWVAREIYLKLYYNKKFNF